MLREVLYHVHLIYHDQSSPISASICERRVTATYQLYLEEDGDTPDRAISDGESVDLRGKVKHFFAVPPATFGLR